MKKTFKTFVLSTIVVLVIYTTIICVYRCILYPRKYITVVEQAASIYNVDPNLIYAIIRQESKFNKDALSHSGAKGLMQLMDATAYDVAKKIESIDPNNYNLYDPYTNILLGTKYMSYLINYFDGNYYLAIVAYNAGMGNVKNWLTKEYEDYTTFSDIYNCIQYSETKNYLNNVIKNYYYYTILY